MKIQYCSDLHLEFPANKEWLSRNPIKPIGDILIIAGDTYHLGNRFSNLGFFDLVANQFEQVFLIPGNHEFYSGVDCNPFQQLDFELQIRDNVHLVNNTVREIDNVELIFSTMWSKIEKQADEVLNALNDFRLIRFEGKPLSIASYNLLFEQAWKFLDSATSTNSGKQQVVITHHLPSALCNIDKYKDSPINEAFCVELTSKIKARKVHSWIYGHSHGNKAIFPIGSTQMHTNQLGYVAYGEHNTFRANAVIEI